MKFRKILTISALGAGLCAAVSPAACLAGEACETYRETPSSTVFWAEEENPGPGCTYRESLQDEPCPSAGEVPDDEPVLFIWIPDMGATGTDSKVGATGTDLTFATDYDPHAGHRALKNEAVDRMNRILDDRWGGQYP